MMKLANVALSTLSPDMQGTFLGDYSEFVADQVSWPSPRANFLASYLKLTQKSGAKGPYTVREFN
jgi:hypothetical protein